MVAKGRSPHPSAAIAYISSPVSPRKPCSRLSPSAPTAQTVGSDPPSAAVTIGAPDRPAEQSKAGRAWSVSARVIPTLAARRRQAGPIGSRLTHDPMAKAWLAHTTSFHFRGTATVTASVRGLTSVQKVSGRAPGGLSDPRRPVGRNPGFARPLSQLKERFCTSRYAPKAAKYSVPTLDKLRFCSSL